MTRFLMAVKFLVTSALFLSLISCSAPSAKFMILSSHHLNPDLNGRSSPVVVMIYQLKKTDTFMHANYEQLTALRNKHSVILRPGQSRQLIIRTDKDTKYFGLIAAYRDLTEAKWRQAIKLPLNRHSIAIEVSLQSQRLAATLKNY